MSSRAKGSSDSIRLNSSQMAVRSSRYRASILLRPLAAAVSSRCTASVRFRAVSMAMAHSEASSLSRWISWGCSAMAIAAVFLNSINSAAVVGGVLLLSVVWSWNCCRFFCLRCSSCSCCSSFRRSTSDSPVTALWAKKYASWASRSCS